MISTSMPHKDRSEIQSYHGGNEVFFSFLRSLFRSVDEKRIAPQEMDNILRTWGGELAQQCHLSHDLGPALEQLGELFSVMGLVRVFEPTDANPGEVKILVLRCLVSRYVNAPRLQEQQAIVPVIQLLVEGALQSVGLSYSVSEERRGMQRTDEYILQITREEQA